MECTFLGFDHQTSTLGDCATTHSVKQRLNDVRRNVSGRRVLECQTLNARCPGVSSCCYRSTQSFRHQPNFVQEIPPSEISEIQRLISMMVAAIAGNAPATGGVILIPDAFASGQTLSAMTSHSSVLSILGAKKCHDSIGFVTLVEPSWCVRSTISGISSTTAEAAAT